MRRLSSSLTHNAQQRPLLVLSLLAPFLLFPVAWSYWSHRSRGFFGPAVPLFDEALLFFAVPIVQGILLKFANIVPQRRAPVAAASSQRIWALRSIALLLVGIAGPVALGSVFDSGSTLAQLLSICALFFLSFGSIALLCIAVYMQLRYGWDIYLRYIVLFEASVVLLAILVLGSFYLVVQKHL